MTCLLRLQNRLVVNHAACQNVLCSDKGVSGRTPDSSIEMVDMDTETWSATFAGISTLAAIGTAGIAGWSLIGIAAALPNVAQLDVDWLNRDGRYGWSPIARIFQTIYWSLALHGCALSLVLIVLGTQNFPWILVLVALWVAVVPIYVLLPWLVFGNIEKSAKARRIERIVAVMAGRDIDADSDPLACVPYINEIERCRRARIRPMRLRGPQFSTFLVVFFLPIVLTAAQVLIPLKFGGH